MHTHIQRQLYRMIARVFSLYVRVVDVCRADKQMMVQVSKAAEKVRIANAARAFKVCVCVCACFFCVYIYIYTYIVYVYTSV